MARKPTSAIVWPSLTLEGNLIAPAMLARITDPDTAGAEAASYGLRKGLTLREEISQAFRVGQAHFDDFAKLALPTPGATARFVRGLLSEAFGFSDLSPAAVPLAFLASDGRIPIAVCPPSDALDKRSAFLSFDRPRSAAYAVQDHLNAQDTALWGLATNGHHLRLMRDNASLTRPAHVEADLRQIFTTEDIASFTALWLLIHRSRFGTAGTPATDCALERWRDQGAREGETARNRLAGQVEEALKLLGSGFLDQNPDLRARVQSGEIPLTDYFNELLRLVYRLIFLMVAEDRDLLHAEGTAQTARDLYAKGYSLTALRRAATRRPAWDRHTDRWEGLRVTFTALAKGEPRLGLTALGGLFAPTALHHLHAARLQNRAFLHALYRLSWLPDPTGMVPVNWRAMETEELGSVYESLLELQPQLDGTRLIFATDTAEQKGNQRKTTGSYYTPDSLVQALLDTALDPVLDQCEAAADPAQALLNLKVIDPACGSGHFLLAAARRIATRVARARHGTPTATDYRHALRDAARACLHGVDRNPMAVELTKVALWIETVDPGKPLGFFDAQIRCGDALLGVFDLKALDEGIPDAAYKPLSGDDRDLARIYHRLNRSQREGQGTLDFSGRSTLPELPALAADYKGFRDLAEETLADVQAKADRYRLWLTSPRCLRDTAACDLYIAAFLASKTGTPPTTIGSRTIPTSEEVWSAKRGAPGTVLHEDKRSAPARDARAFHWPLQFPDVFANGGFDVVLGNPPWEVMQLSEKEYFAARHPHIAGLAGSARKKAIEELAVTEPAVFDEYIRALRTTEAVTMFTRHSERFPLSAEGKLNTYALFAELFANLIRRGGASGAILPTGIATDKFNAAFFSELAMKSRIKSLISFENEEFIFPAIHHSTRFCLLTLTSAKNTRAEYSFFLRSTTDLDDPRRKYSISNEEISRLNPLTKTAPIFRTRTDANLTLMMYDCTPIFSASHNIESGEVLLVQNFFSTSTPSDARIIVPPGQRLMDIEYSPILRGTMIDQFNHFAAKFFSDTGEFHESNPSLAPDSWDEVSSDKYVPTEALKEKLHALGWRHQWMLGWRDITSAHVNRTMISTVFPVSATDDTLSLILPKGGAATAVGLVANLCSLPLDYIARQKVGGNHIRKYVIAQLPILPPSFYTPERLAFLTPRVLELTYTSHALAPFARDLGFDGPPFPWDEPRRAHLRADLDAFYARAYRLTRDDLRYILDPADVMGPDYPSETFRVLKEKETRHHGEYRTRRLVLEAWDRMEADGTFPALDL